MEVFAPLSSRKRLAAVQCIVSIRFHLLGKSLLLSPPRGGPGRAEPLMAPYTLLCSRCIYVGVGGGGGVAVALASLCDRRVCSAEDSQSCALNVRIIIWRFVSVHFAHLCSRDVSSTQSNSYDLSSFSTLTLLVRSFDPQKPVPDMIYNVFGGTLNLALSNHQVLRPQVQVQVLVPSTTCLLCSVFEFACNQLSPHAAVRIECI